MRIEKSRSAWCLRRSASMKLSLSSLSVLQVTASTTARGRMAGRLGEAGSRPDRVVR
jgi:hypothetical protein